jgi:hypothetical protein
MDRIPNHPFFGRPFFVDPLERIKVHKVLAGARREDRPSEEWLVQRP